MCLQILLSWEARILYSLLLQPWTCLLKNSSKGVCFIFEFVCLKSLGTKQKVRTEFATFIVKLHNMILLRACFIHSKDMTHALKGMWSNLFILTR